MDNWENAIQKSESKKVYIYIIEENKISELSAKEKITENDFDKIYKLTLEDIIKLNWHIKYTGSSPK